MTAKFKTLWDAPENKHLNLIQWHVRHEPWRVLVVCIFCNLTRRNTAEPYIWQFFDKWGTPEAASTASISEVVELIKPLGLSMRRAKALINMSRQYTAGEWSAVTDLPGVGRYADDAWKIFVLGIWDEMESPKDHALKAYWEWLFSWQDDVAYAEAKRLQQAQEDKITKDFINYTDYGGER